MNSTTTTTTIPVLLLNSYTSPEKGILSLTGILFTPLMSVCFYVWSRKRLKGKKSHEQRVYLFYRAMAGILLGLFLCHIFLKSTTYSTLGFQVMSLFVLLGVIFIDIYDNWTRVCNENVHYVASGNNFIDSEIGLDRDKMEQTSYVHLDGSEMSTDTLGILLFDKADERKDSAKRWHLFLCLFLCLGLIVVLEGMFLIYNERDNKGLLIAAYYLTQALQNASVFGGMIYSRIHLIPGRSRYFWWWSLTFLWSVIVTCATIPVLSNMSPDVVENAITNYWLSIFYSFSGGLLLGISFHFRGMKLENTDKRDTVISEIIYILFSILAWLAGLFV